MRRTILLFAILAITPTGFTQVKNPILRLETGMHGAQSYRVSTDRLNNLALTCSEDNTARLWDVHTGKQLNVLRIPILTNQYSFISSCAITRDGRFAVLTASSSWTDSTENSILYILDVQTGEMIHQPIALPGIARDIEMSPNGMYFAVGYTGKNGVVVFSCERWDIHKKLEGYEGRVLALAFDKNNKLATVCYDGKLRLYDSKFNLLNEQNELSGKRPGFLTFDPEATRMAVGYWDVNTIDVFENGSLNLMYRPDVTGVNNVVNALSFSPDGKKLIGGGYADLLMDTAAGKWNKIVRIWDRAGEGTYTDRPVLLKNIIIDIKPVDSNQLLVLGLYPCLFRIDASGEIIWFTDARNNDLFAGLNTRHLRTSHAGSSIGFTPQFDQPMSFDISERALTTATSKYPAQTDSVQGIKVTNWNSDYAKINGRAVPFQNQSRGVDITKNGSAIVFAADGLICKTDSTGKILWSINPPSNPWCVKITGNEKLLLTTLADGTIRWFRMEDGREVLSFFLDLDKKRWILFTPSGYYDASPGAEDLLGWHVNNGLHETPSFFPVSRFREQYYRPDIIDAIFETNDEGSAIALADRRRGKTGAKNNVTTQKLPPTVVISSPASGSSFSTEKITVSYLIKDQNSNADSLRVLVNGRPVSYSWVAENSSRSPEKSIRLEIPREDCAITLLAENEFGTSPEANLFLKWDGQKKNINQKPNLYILSIGISEYQKEQYRLTYAAKDADDFTSAMLKQKGKFYENVICRKLVDAEASKENILNGLEWIQKNTTAHDMAMIFFAGHGINDNNGFYYMLPADADINYLRSSCINFEEVKQTQSTIKGKVIVFIDACHSGNVVGNSGNDINGLINFLTSTVKGAGAITITSSTGREKSFEDPKWGNGAFTKTLLEGLSGAAFAGEENEISYTSLALYISRQVKKLTDDRQHPTLVPTPNTPDFPIAYAK